MKKLTRILVIAFFTIAVLAVIVPFTAYVMLSTPWAHEKLRATLEKATDELLGVDTRVDEVKFRPFNRLRIIGVSIDDDNDNDAIKIQTIAARFELADFIFNGKLVIDYAVVDGLEAHISRSTPDSPLNIEGIIKNLAKSDSNSEKSEYDFRLNDVEILNSTICYDVESEPHTYGEFNKNHIRLSSLNAVIYAPTLSSNSYGITLKSLNFCEDSGFCVDKITCNLLLTEKELSVKGLNIIFQESKIVFGDISSSIESIDSVGCIFKKYPVTLSIQDGSYIYPPDFKAFFPQLEKFKENIDLTLQAVATSDSIHMESIGITTASGMTSITAKGNLVGLSNPDSIRADGIRVSVTFNPTKHSSLGAQAISLLPDNIGNIANRMMKVSADVALDGMIQGCNAKVNINTAIGSLNTTGWVSYKNRRLDFKINGLANDISAGAISNVDDIGRFSASISASGSIGNKITGKAHIFFPYLEYKDYTYHNLDIEANADHSGEQLRLSINDDNAKAQIFSLSDLLNGDDKYIKASAKIDKLNPDSLHLYDAFPGHTLSANINLDWEGQDLRFFKGNLNVDNLSFVDSIGKGLKLKSLDVIADNVGQGMDHISVFSDYLNGSLQGQYDILDIWPDCRDIICETFPPVSKALGYHKGNNAQSRNEFSFDFTISNAAIPSMFFKLPVTLTDPVSISGELSQNRHQFIVSIDAPWMVQGDKIVEGTNIYAIANSETGLANLYATTFMPTKKGPMLLVATVAGSNDTMKGAIDWEIQRDIPINGKFNIETILRNDIDNNLITQVDFLPGQINFGSDAWNINPSSILIEGKNIDVHNFSMTSDKQALEINGKISENPSDSLLVNLANFHLVDIFETLDIDKALLCGSATGQIMASSLYSSSPVIRSTNFKVKDIGYNYCVLGDGDLELGFDAEQQAFCFDADIYNPQGALSKIRGSIVPATESLDLYFDANRVNVGFMQPYMKAFCSSIKGYGSGQAHLFGTFKYVDLVGELFVEDLKLKIDFTNAWYSATDSIHMRPGEITLNDITIRDEYGNKALLNGTVWHKFFKEPSFDFAITDAKDFLCYDVQKENSPRWHGTIFGNGFATVKGVPGVVNIGAAMSTAKNTKFTFELTDREVAQEYSFINFRDVTPNPLVVDSILDIPINSIAQSFASLEEDEGNSGPTAYNMDLAIDITPEAKMEIVMDPIGGDKISCTGKGHLRLVYESLNDIAKMFGEYVLDYGNYGFAWQDLIFRDFKIKDGSKITFSGSPFDAMLDIDAFYQLNANLSDLDESFLNDKELNSTNVQVHAVMNVTGNMRQPDIAFSLEFPKLNQDIDRKVRSIISTDDMMNMQIIYLLTLNRFYTPDYMSTTKGNELFSVASSTISNQLSSALGKLSDNWSIAPNLRSNRGDFSDLEVDVTLESNLLNNRLLLNGNLGYRDKSLNTNQFIGDFDAQYLLNKGGSLRLKAYSRYNDQNYYLRTAKTTQGIGFIYKRDFDDMFRFLNPHKHKSFASDSIPSDDKQNINPVSVPNLEND